MPKSGKQQIRIIIDGLESDAEQVIKKLTLDVVANLTKAPVEGGTPVDTGWARANWIANVATPVTEAVGSAEAPTLAEAAQQASLGSVLGYKLRSGPVFISNNVPYILRLNDGSSKQAPAGFVQRAIQLAVTQLRAAI
mgnify:CR=1 FL=1|tara:strand:+ start:28799 stop:29212 length:414 start_codon:yes stop_codon:yes gene_type:complete